MLDKKMEKVNKADENNEKKPEKKQDYNKTLIKIGVFLGILVLFFVAWMVMSSLQASFEYRGVEFQKVKEIAPYKTTLPLTYGSGITGGAIQKVDYNFYMRNDPRRLEEIPFEGELEIKKILVVRSEEEFQCKGYGTIGMANLVQLYQAIGIKVIKDHEANCSESGDYMLLEIVLGNETKIERIGEACYRMSVNNCEILPVTERFMVETFVLISNRLENSGKE